LWIAPHHTLSLSHTHTHTHTHKIIGHYAPSAANPQHAKSRRTLFITSLGPFIALSNRRASDFYIKPPANPHPGKLGYHAMADMLAHHIKVRTPKQRWWIQAAGDAA
jgi:hypothetical protein